MIRIKGIKNNEVKKIKKAVDGFIVSGETTIDFLNTDENQFGKVEFLSKEEIQYEISIKLTEEGMEKKITAMKNIPADFGLTEKILLDQLEAISYIAGYLSPGARIPRASMEREEIEKGEIVEIFEMLEKYRKNISLYEKERNIYTASKNANQFRINDLNEKIKQTKSKRTQEANQKTIKEINEENERLDEQVKFSEQKIKDYKNNAHHIEIDALIQEIANLIEDDLENKSILKYERKQLI